MHHPLSNPRLPIQFVKVLGMSGLSETFTELSGRRGKREGVRAQGFARSWASAAAPVGCLAHVLSMALVSGRVCTLPSGRKDQLKPPGAEGTSALNAKGQRKLNLSRKRTHLYIIPEHDLTGLMWPAV